MILHGKIMITKTVLLFVLLQYKEITNMAKLLNALTPCNHSIRDHVFSVLTTHYGFSISQSYQRIRTPWNSRNKYEIIVVLIIQAHGTEKGTTEHNLCTPQRTNCTNCQIKTMTKITKYHNRQTWSLNLIVKNIPYKIFKETQLLTQTNDTGIMKIIFEGPVTYGTHLRSGRWLWHCSPEQRKNPGQVERWRLEDQTREISWMG